MKNIVDAVRQVVRNDPLILSLVGTDEWNQVKFYDEVAPKDTSPPFLVWSVAPSPSPEGAYAQDDVITYLNVQFSSWCEEIKRSWQLSDAVEEAVAKGAYEASPWEFMQVRRVGAPQPLPDRDTSWFQVALTVQFQFSGPSRTQ